RRVSDLRPCPRRVLRGTIQAVTHNLLLFSLLAVGTTAILWSWAQTEQGRLWIDRAKFNLPLFGPLIRMYAVTKFSWTLGVLTASGTQILSALKVTRPVPGNKVLEQGIDFVRSRVEQGMSLSRALSESGAFPEMLVQMTA